METLEIDPRLADIQFSNLEPQKPASSSARPLSRSNRDHDELVRLGKKPVLKRNFGFMSILGFSCTSLITWEASLIVLQQTLTNGGPSGFVYGFIFVWTGTLAIFTTLSELSSMAPTAGGQYHWVSMLAPHSSRKFYSYITGWLTVIGWQAVLASAVYVSATLVQGLIILTRPDYRPQPWHAVLLFWATIALAVFINTKISSILPKFEGLILVIHILGFFAIALPLIVLGPRQEPSQVFNLFKNEGGMPTQGLSFMIGVIGSVWTFAGADGAVHMSEEIRNASTVVPRSILLSILINGSLSLGMIIITLFNIDDIDAVLKSPTGYPFIEVFLQATGSVSGAAIMTSIIVVMQFCADVGLLTSCSRMSWSFARDRGLPGWRVISKVNPHSSIPISSVIMTSIISCILSLLSLGSLTAFNNIISITIAGLFTSYLLATTLLLYRRCTGGIQSFQNINTANPQLRWGPFHIPGTWGIIVNVYACVYMIVAGFFSFWPPYLPVTAGNMNYSILVTGVVILFSVIWYFVSAKKEYKGPVMEVFGAK